MSFDRVQDYLVCKVSKEQWYVEVYSYTCVCLCRNHVAAGSTFIKNRSLNRDSLRMKTMSQLCIHLMYVSCVSGHLCRSFIEPYKGAWLDQSNIYLVRCMNEWRNTRREDFVPELGISAENFLVHVKEILSLNAAVRFFLIISLQFCLWNYGYNIKKKECRKCFCLQFFELHCVVF